MHFSFSHLGLRLRQAGLLPQTKVALAAWYILALDVLLVALQQLSSVLHFSYGQSLGGWVGFLSFVVIVLFFLLALRWLKTRLLWRLRNRLIVTYVFIGVIPVVMLVVLTLGSFYLFAGQFATFIVTSGLDSELKSVEASNSTIAHQFAAQFRRGAANSSAALDSLRQQDESWTDRQVCVWLDNKLVLNSVPAGQNLPPVTLPSYLKRAFRNVVRDQDKLYLRAMEVLPVGNHDLTVLSNEPFDQHMLQGLAANLGEVTLYASGLSLRKVEPPPGKENASASVTLRRSDGGYILDTGNQPLQPTYTAGTVPPPTRSLDRQVTLPTTVFVVNWDTGATANPVAISVQTRVSKLYERLFGALGDFAPAAEFFLLFVAIVFGVIEVAALFIGTQLTRTVTGAVAQLYDATRHINRGDFGHRIPVKSSDQIATLANSFNSMTASLEKLMEEQKEKQRLENELVIAQEVQAQLFPRQISQLASLEVHGFCRPARTVSGDYYDFLAVDSDNLLLAVGDISGKGISAALLMATIHSAVRAYSLENVSVLRQPAGAGAERDSALMLANGAHGGEVSPGALLALLNHQLYESTPAEKYATLFLALYNGLQRNLTYSNGGHLPPIILSRDGSFRRLESGGTVVGLFDDQAYDEGSAQLRAGEIFLAYSDGVTEPENDYGEFGEPRLIELLRENLDLPLGRISEIVTAAVDDWIGAKEQPDDITLVLARAR